MADEILGPERARVRALQAFWKQRLREAVLEDGRDSVVGSLKKPAGRAQ